VPSPAFTPPAAHDAPLPPAREAAAGTRVLPGVPYAALPGIRPLELDVWLPPESRAPAPAVLFLHGGGWRADSPAAAQRVLEETISALASVLLPGR
jgi:acetyl esterase/lipase